jgi:hypothetical protein
MKEIVADIMVSIGSKNLFDVALIVAKMTDYRPSL